MNPKHIEQLISYFQHHNAKLKHNPIEEITLEANPSTFEINKFKEFKDAGINRISIGIQSFFNDNLKFLGRNHNALEGIKALEESSKIFDKMSFDLIVGLPNQSFENIQNEVKMALQFFRGHISLYQLTIEEGTPFYKNKIKTIDEEGGEKFYTYIIDTLAQSNIIQYEISNFSIPQHQSIHNLNYWLGGEYVGIGPNAWGRVFFNNQWISTKEYKNPNKWLEKSQSNPIEEYQILSSKERFEEMIMTELRVNKPLNMNLYKMLDANKIQKLLQENLIVKSDESITTTHKGKMCLNYVISNLLI
jgi:oxygen-independent coproporphyrinogen-3 oxidase